MDYVKCTKLNAPSQPRSTCLKRQEIILNLKRVKGKKWKHETKNKHLTVCDGCTDYLKKKNKVETPGEVGQPKLKRCIECKQELPASTEYFGRANASPDKLTKSCLECRGEKLPSSAPKPKSEKPKPSTKKKTKTGLRPHLIVDFAKHPELLETLKELAAHQIRTPEQQALWLIKRTLKEIQ